MSEEPGAGDTSDSEVFVGIASVGFRRHMLQGAVESLIDQVDEMGVYLNHYDEVPDYLDHPRITVVRSQQHGDQRDNGKFCFLDRCRHRFYVSADDDIVYPPNYIARMKACLVQAGPMAAVGVHGALYPTDVVGLLWPRHLFHFTASLPYVMPVHVAGTGTLMFDQSEWKLRFDEFGEPGMADLWFAKSARRRGGRLLVINRDKRWLEPIDPADDSELTGQVSTLHAEADADGSFQNRLLRDMGVSDRGFEQVIGSICASDHLTTTLSLTHALYLDDVRNTLGWPPLDPSAADALGGRLRECRLGWHHLPACDGLDIEAYSDAAVAALTHDVNTDLAMRAADVVERCSSFADDDRQRWRQLPLPLRFDTRTSRMRRVTSFLFEHAIQRDRPGAALVWDRVSESGDVAVGWALEAERAGVESGIQHLASFQTLARKNPVGAATHLRAYLDARAWRVDLDPLALRRAFGSALDQKEVQLLAAMSALRLGQWERAARTVERLRHRSPADFDVQLMSSAVSAQAAPNPGRALGCSLPVIDSLLTDVGLTPFANHLRPDTEGLSHWIHALGRGVDAGPGDDAQPSRITVIMAVHNDRETVRAAVGSVLAAVGADLELIVVDDASEDGTADIIASIDDHRVVTIRNPGNLGPYVSRNRAIRRATGEFITVADADDWSHPERFRYQRDRLLAEPELMGCTASHIRVTADGTVDLENNLSFVGHGPVSLMFRRTVVDQIGGFDHVRTRGDIEFIRRIQARFGDRAVGAFGAPLILATASPASNSKRYSDASLARFRRSFRSWHARARHSDRLYVELVGARAPFVAPDELIVRTGQIPDF